MQSEISLSYKPPWDSLVVFYKLLKEMEAMNACPGFIVYKLSRCTKVCSSTTHNLFRLCIKFLKELAWIQQIKIWYVSAKIITRDSWRDSRLKIQIVLSTSVSFTLYMLCLKNKTHIYTWNVICIYICVQCSIMITYLHL